MAVVIAQGVLGENADDRTIVDGLDFGNGLN